MTFTWHDQTLTYHDHWYNTTALNERAVELPIALSFLAAQTGDGLEVGNVLGHYGVFGHRVVDLYEQEPGVDNTDLFDVTGSYDWVVSISTVEHVRWDTEPRDPNGSVQAVTFLRALLRPGGHLLVTAPLGHQPHLDQAIRTGELGPTEDCVYVRAGDGWVQSGRETWRPYGVETQWAGAVWIATWDQP